MRSTCVSVVCVLAAAAPAFAAGFKVADATIDPAADQQITVLATGVLDVEGMNLLVQVQGAPLAITGITIDGTIWVGNNTGPVISVYPDGGLPNAQFGIMSITTAAGTVATPGAIAVLTVDATGLEGETAVITANYFEAPSDWAGIPSTGYEDGTITIRTNEPPANEPPVVNAGPDQAVTAGDTVALSGTASDPENAPLTYLWLQIAGPTVTLSSTTSASPTFTAPAVVSATVIEFQFRASDGTSTRTDTVVITVNPVPDTGGSDDPGTDPPPSDPPPPTDDGDDDGGDDQTTDPPDPSDDDSAGDTGTGDTNGSDTSTQPDGNNSTGGTTTPTGGTSDTSGTQDHTSNMQAGNPACAMGIAEAALFACAGFWMLLWLPLRRAERN